MVTWKLLSAAAVGVTLMGGCRQAFLPEDLPKDSERKGATMTHEATAIKTAGRIEWLGWGEEAFRRARDEDKLIVLDSGATWCHWCHVMDRVTYEDADVAGLIARKFIPVRIDRDRSPEVDAYLQHAPPLIESGGGGWPLTVVLTGDGHVLYKTTFLPPRSDPHFGARVGLIDVLEGVEEVWRTRRDEIERTAGELRQQAQAGRAELFRRPGKVEAKVIDEVYGGIADAYDAAHGGFGAAPKFFNAPALRLLLLRGWAGDKKARAMLTHTLEAMARGGVYDQIGGGFHRYSVDERWHVPHFEKMAYDNAAMLALYADAAALTGRADFAGIATDIRRWVDRDLTGGQASGSGDVMGKGDRHQGGELEMGDRHRNGEQRAVSEPVPDFQSVPVLQGFYASQDADVGLDDDGDYFTWTLSAVRQALSPELAATAVSYYGIDEFGDMPDRPGRNVLHLPKTLGQETALLGVKDGELAERVAAIRRRLLEARAKRATPAVDRTVMADLNGMMIDAYLTLWERLGDDSARATALRTLDALLAGLRDARGVFAHWRSGEGPEGLRNVGMLADQAWMMRALTHAFVATAEPKYLAAAQILADYIVGHLVDCEGGLVDAPTGISGEGAGGPASVRAGRSWEDGPAPSAASVAAAGLVDLGRLSGRDRYGLAAGRALATFAGGVTCEMGLFLAGYAGAVDDYLHGPRCVVVAGAAESPVTAGLAETARRTCLPGGLVIVLDPTRTEHAAILGSLGYAARPAEPTAYVCHGSACLAPARTPEELAARIEELKGKP
jgi:uncharacterized protein